MITIPYTQADIDAAVAAVKKSVQVCNKQRRKPGVMESLSKTNYNDFTEGRKILYIYCAGPYTCFYYPLSKHVQTGESMSFYKLRQIICVLFRLLS